MTTRQTKPILAYSQGLYADGMAVSTYRLASASGDVVVFRTTDGQRTAARFDIDKLKAGKADDPQMQPGDVVDERIRGPRLIDTLGLAESDHVRRRFLDHAETIHFQLVKEDRLARPGRAGEYVPFQAGRL